MTIVPVVAAIITKGGKVLIAQRKPGCAREPLKWEFPGGKVEEGETPQQALAREIMEELGVRIEVGEPFSVTSAFGGGMHIVLIAFMARLRGGEPKAIDVNDWRWVRRSELAGYDWAHADRPIASKLAGKGRIKTERGED